MGGKWLEEVSMAIKGQHENLTWKYSIFCLYEHKHSGRDVILWFCKMLPLREM